MNTSITNGISIEQDNAEEHFLRLVVLVENTSCSEDITPEHGLSIYIEFNGKRGLYDTGQTDVVLKNAISSYVDLEDLDWLALSHGHYDHTGGLLPVLKESNKTIPVFAGEGVFGKKIAKRDNDVLEPIGLPFSREELELHAASFTEVGECAEISQDVFLIGPAPFIELYEEPAKYLMVEDQAGNLIGDKFFDERTLVLRTPEGLVIITGCAHRGAVNIIKHIKKLFPEDKIVLVLGGFHLGKTKEEVIRQKIEAFKDFDIEGIGLCHCTGAKASRNFIEAMPENCFIAPAGSEIIL